MATERLRTIMPSGGDYTSAAAWESGEQADLVALDEYRVGEISGTWSSADATRLVIAGWTTNADCYPELRVVSASRHPGSWSDSRYRLVVVANDQEAVRVEEPYTRLIGLQVQPGGSATTWTTGIGCTVDAPNSLIDGCIVRGGGIQFYVSGIWVDGANVSIRNCCVFGISGTAAYRRGIINGASSATGVTVYNCTVYDCGTGIAHTAGDWIVRNCIAQACTDGFSGSFATGSSHNSSNIASDAPGTSAQTGTVSFVATATFDFHLQSTDTVARGNGVSLSGTFSNDIDGGSRGSTWDIGADQDTAAGGSALTASLSDALSLGDTVGRSMALGRSLADTVAIGDSFDRSAAFARALSDAVALGDASARAMAADRSLTDPVALGDTVSPAAYFARALTDAITIGDSVAAAIVIARELSDALSLDDSVSRQLALSRVLTEAIVLAEQLGGSAAFARSLADALDLADALAGSVIPPDGELLVRALSDAIALGDSTTASAQLVRAIADAISLTDSTTTAAIFIRLVTDGLSISDALTASALLVRSLGDQVALADRLIGYLGGIDVPALRGVIESLRLRATIADQRLRGRIDRY